MAYSVTDLRALEILDSRGRPTLQVSLVLDSGASAEAGVPAGASTGSREAVELRDGDVARYGGRGVLRAVRAVEEEIGPALAGRRWALPREVDQALIELDGTPTKGRLGANAIVGVSMAVARAVAAQEGIPLWRSLTPDGVAPRLPVPHFNVINGGAHAGNQLDFQEFMIAPRNAPTFAEALRAGAEIYAELRGLLAAQGLSTGLGDEGGFAPDLATPEEVLDLLVAAIAGAGYDPAPDQVAIALDPAANGFQGSPGTYQLGEEALSASQLIDRYEALAARYPIWSIEDGLAEDDRSGWAELTRRLGGRLQLVGDDIFVTSPRIIGQAIADGIANAALIKVNQIGTVSETLDAMAVCRAGGYAQMISHRSGETPDAFIADLAVGTGCGLIKSGAPARGERLAKYNRLLEIETRDRP